MPTSDQEPGEPLTESDRRRAQKLLITFGRLGAAVTAALHERVDPTLSSNVEVLVITILDLHGPQRPADIGTLTGMSSGGVTKLLDRLEQHGLIAREHNRIKGDRRATQLVLTERGTEVAGLLAEGLNSRMDAVREAVDEMQAAASSRPG